MAVITTGAHTIAPHLLLGYQSSRESGNVFHPLIDSPTPDITLRPAAPRTGTLELFFLTGVAATACERLHAGARLFHLRDSARPSTNMTYVVDGNVTCEVAEGGARWIVSVAYHEISS